MKIKISQLGPAGIRIDEEISQASINERLTASDEGEIIATSTMNCHLRLEPAYQGAQLLGTASCEIEQDCALCGERQKHEVSTLVDMACKPSTTGDESEDLGITFYTDDFLSTDSVCEELLLLQITGFWQCDRCKNKRPAAPVVIAPSTKLGELLEKVIKKIIRGSG